MNIEKFIEPNNALSKLRDYQLPAVRGMLEYYIHYKDNKNPKTGLVAMPTGSGKTIIIGILATCFNQCKSVLIVSPRVAISKQIYYELSYRFFPNRLKVSNSLNKKIEYFEKELEYYWKDLDKTVLISTIHKIDNLAKNNNKDYKDLLKKISLVIFDEGHYEPAISWSKTIRQFKKPRIIFSATPFRNDFKAFDIDWDRSITISHYKVLSSNYIRNVEFKEKRKLATTEKTVSEIINLYNEVFANDYRERSNPKVIITCESADSIIDISNVLHTKNLDFIAIHERFKSNYLEELDKSLKQHLRYRVPEKKEIISSFIWVHQYKLLEGIDDPSFQMLVIYDQLRNTRALIQQIGRIIRNPQKRSEIAYVYNYSSRNYKNDWEKYCEYDRQEISYEKFTNDVYEKFKDQLPKITYIDGELKEKFEGEEFENWLNKDLMDSIRLPLKINLYEKLRNFNLNTVLNLVIEARLKDEDKIWYKSKLNKDSYLYYYFTVKNSDYLSDKYFPEISHDIIFILNGENYIAYFDSGGSLTIGKDKFGIGMGLNPSKLKKLFSKGNRSIISRVALKNANIGLRDIRNHAFVAPSIEETTPFLNDHAHFINSVFGQYVDMNEFKIEKSKIKNEKILLKTYIGFSTGRISQSEQKNVTLREYINWIRYLIKIIKSRKQYISTFDRYATDIVNKTDDKPKNILIDLFEIEEDYQFDLTKGIDSEFSELIEDKCLNITKENGNYYFKLNINKTEYIINVDFDRRKKKYILDSPTLKQDLIGTTKSTQQKKINFLDILNEKQLFRIITEKNLLYFGGRFYNPSIKYGDNFKENNYQVGRILFSIDVLDEVGSEKGTVSLNDGEDWQENSLFGLVSRLGLNSQLENEFIGTKLLICTDLGTEAADFILFNEHKLVFIHIKGVGNDPNKRKIYSASGISEVCNQVIKNIHLLSMFDDSEPGNLSYWSRPWKLNEKSGFIVNDRVRVNVDNINIDNIWNKIEELKFDPNTDREVWILLGKLFSKATFINQMKGNNPEAEVLQSALILQNTLASVGSIGAKLKVFCGM